MRQKNHDSLRDWDLLIIVILAIFAITMLLTFTSCVTVPKAEKKLDETGKGAGYCAVRFPPKDSTVFIAGDTVTEISFYHDTTYQPVTDTIYKEGGYTVEYRPCPPTKVITKRITDTIKETKWDVYGVAACKDQLAALKAKYDIVVAERDKARKQAKNRLWWILILIGGGGVYLFLKLKKIVK